MEFQKVIQNEDPEEDAVVGPSAPQTVDYFRRVRRVSRLNARRPWKRTVSTRLPMLVMVHQGVLIVRREGNTHMVLTGDVLLLRPGNFELVAVPVLKGGDVCFEHSKIPLAVFRNLLGDGSWIEQVALGDTHHRLDGVHVQASMVPKITRDLELKQGNLTGFESIFNTMLISFCPTLLSFFRTVYFLSLIHI